PARRAQLLPEAVEAARHITGPHRRCRVYEYLLPHFPARQAEGLLALALACAEGTADPDDRARALARLSRRLSGERQVAVLRSALEATGAIADEGERAEVLALLKPFVRSIPELLADQRRRARALSGAWERARALGLRGQHLALAYPLLRQATPGSEDLWTPL